MKKVLLLAFIFIVSCNKQSPEPPANAGTNTGSVNNTNTSAALVSPSKITVFVNQVAMPVTSINYNRGGSTFNFSAQNKLQKVDVNCFWFYQQSGFNYQFSDSITYSTRPDTLTNWNTERAINWGDVSFDCCYAPLTDSLVVGEYSGDFLIDKSNLTINGDFHLVF